MQKFTFPLFHNITDGNTSEYVHTIAISINSQEWNVKILGGGSNFPSVF